MKPKNNTEVLSSAVPLDCRVRGEWIAVPTLGTVGEYPDFREYGFHTDNRIIVRRRDGSEQETFYGGYGMFGKDDFMDVTHWRPSPNVK